MLNDQKVTRRGYVAADEREFSGERIIALKKAQAEIHWLLDRDYQVNNHRQRRWLFKF
jgi:hypothetical protein